MKDNNISQEKFMNIQKIHGKIWYGFGGSRKAT